MIPCKTIWEDACGLGMAENALLLIVDASTQRMSVMQHGDVVACYAVATSKFGLGNIMESYRTPTGFMEVVERYGDGLEPGAVFFEREPTGARLLPEQWQAASGKDYILTRILRLGGLQDDVNRGGEVDTYERYVYLHGSDCEQHLGLSPASHGCIHVGNHDIVALFDQLKNAPVWCWVGEDVKAADMTPPVG